MCTKSVRISLRSIIDNLSDTGLPSDDREMSESSAVGRLSLGNSGPVIEFTEGGECGEVKTKIELSGKNIRVRRHGAIEADLLFSEGVGHSSLYGAVPYTFDMSIFTKKIRGEITEVGGTVDIFYDMEIGGAKKSVKMTLLCEV